MEKSKDFKSEYTEDLDKKIEVALEKRIEVSKSRFFEMQNSAWGWDDEKKLNENGSENFETLNLEEGNFTYDINKIEITNIFIDPELEGDLDFIIDYYENLGPDWIFIGMNNGLVVMARPFWKELNIKLDEEVEFSIGPSDYGGYTNILKIRSLNIGVQDVSFTPDSNTGIDRELLFEETDHPSKACLITIEREDLYGKDKENNSNFEDKQSFFQKRNPDFAERTLNKELRIALTQLENLGYSYIFCYPSDSRREKIYKHTGLKEIVPRKEKCAPLLGGKIRDNFFMK